MSASSVRVKICGVTRPEDARIIADAGAEAIGLNLVAGPRRIDPDRTLEILEALPECVEAWVLADVSGGDLPDPVRSMIASGRIARVQMYGRVGPETIQRLTGRYGLSTVAVRHIADESSITDTAAWLDRCKHHPPDLVLLDAAPAVGRVNRPDNADTSGAGKGPSPTPDKLGSSTLAEQGWDTRLGGTGRPLNWRMLAEQQQAGRLDGWPALVLAGGLDAENVAQAIQSVRPAWVDVASGVEDEPGRKHEGLVRRFITSARPPTN